MCMCVYAYTFQTNLVKVLMPFFLYCKPGDSASHDDWNIREHEHSSATFPSFACRKHTRTHSLTFFCVQIKEGEYQQRAVLRYKWKWSLLREKKAFSYISFPCIESQNNLWWKYLWRLFGSSLSWGAMFKFRDHWSGCGDISTALIILWQLALRLVSPPNYHHTQLLDWMQNMPSAEV